MENEIYQLLTRWEARLEDRKKNSMGYSSDHEIGVAEGRESELESNIEELKEILNKEK